MSLSWIIYSSIQLKHDIKENIHPDWLNKGSQYNTAMCSQLHGTALDDFIRINIADRCNIMCFIPAHVKQQPTYVDDAGSDVGREIPKNAKTAPLESLGTTLNFIHCWLQLFHNNNEVR